MRLPWKLVVFLLRVGERSVRCGDEEEARSRRPGRKVPERPGWDEVGESCVHESCVPARWWLRFQEDAGTVYGLAEGWAWGSQVALQGRAAGRGERNSCRGGESLQSLLPSPLSSNRIFWRQMGQGVTVYPSPPPPSPGFPSQPTPLPAFWTNHQSPLNTGEVHKTWQIHEP